MKKIIALEFGKNLKKIRKLRKMTSKHLAALCDMNHVTLSQIEGGQRFISANSLSKLCRALECEPSELFERFEVLEKDQKLLDQIVKKLLLNPSKIKDVLKIINALVAEK